MSFSIITRVVDNCIDCVSSTSRLYCLRGHGHLSWCSQGQHSELHFKDTDKADIPPIQSLTSRPDIVTLVTGFFASVCLVWFLIEFFPVYRNYLQYKFWKVRVMQNNIAHLRNSSNQKTHLRKAMIMSEKKASPFLNIRLIWSFIYKNSSPLHRERHCANLVEIGPVVLVKTIFRFL